MKLFLLIVIACIAFKAIKTILSELRKYLLYSKCLEEVIDSSRAGEYAYCLEKVISSTHPDIILYNKIERQVFGYFFALCFAVVDRIYNVDFTEFEYQKGISISVKHATVHVLKVLQEDGRLLRNAYWNYAEMRVGGENVGKPVDFLSFKRLLTALIHILTWPD